MTLGKHTTWDFWGVSDVLLDNLEVLRAILMEAAEAGNCTVVDSVFHKFSPIGVTGVLVLAESHLSIHTWPEEGYCAIDIFTCGDSVNAEALDAVLGVRLRPTKAVRNHLERG